ncbi:MAG: hypothetical protein ACI83Y_001229 [Candidatus Azotimanducaceae bacterium]|jgi:hypothetical protein
MTGGGQTPQGLGLAAQRLDFEHLDTIPAQLDDDST